MSVRGKFETVYDPPPPPPNGTGFDDAARVAPPVGRDERRRGAGDAAGRDVLEAMSRLPTVKDNTNSPFFAVAKSIGDKRALVAESAFRKPFKKVVFKNCGVLPEAQAAGIDGERERGVMRCDALW